MVQRTKKNKQKNCKNMVRVLAEVDGVHLSECHRRADLPGEQTQDATILARPWMGTRVWYRAVCARNFAGTHAPPCNKARTQHETHVQVDAAFPYNSHQTRVQGGASTCSRRTQDVLEKKHPEGTKTGVNHVLYARRRSRLEPLTRTNKTILVRQMEKNIRATDEKRGQKTSERTQPRTKKKRTKAQTCSEALSYPAPPTPSSAPLPDFRLLVLETHTFCPFANESAPAPAFSAEAAEALRGICACCAFGCCFTTTTKGGVFLPEEDAGVDFLEFVGGGVSSSPPFPPAAEAARRRGKEGSCLFVSIVRAFVSSHRRRGGGGGGRGGRVPNKGK